MTDIDKLKAYAMHFGDDEPGTRYTTISERLATLEAENERLRRALVEAHKLVVHNRNERFFGKALDQIETLTYETLTGDKR